MKLHSLVLLAVLAGPVSAALQQPTPAPAEPAGQQVEVAREPAALQKFLPAFQVRPAGVPEGEDFRSPSLSPSGLYCLIQQLTSGGRGTVLLDREGQEIRRLAAEEYPFVAAIWGSRDNQLFLECRREAGGKPEYLEMERNSGKVKPAPLPRLARWSVTGRDYYLPAPKPTTLERYQRFNLLNKPVGRTLSVVEPTWSPDGLSIAYLRGRIQPPDVPAAQFSPIREVRVNPARGDLPRVVLSWAAWDKLMKERGWTWASGPERVHWSGKGDALYGFCRARTGAEERRYLLRMDLNSPTRELIAVEEGTEIVSASADGKVWLLRLGDGLHRIEFEGAAGSPRKE